MQKVGFIQTSSDCFTHCFKMRLASFKKIIKLFENPFFLREVVSATVS